MRILNAVLVLLFVAACSGSPTPTPMPTPPVNTISGTFVLKQDSTVDINPTAKQCTGTGGYRDIAVGAPVTVTDASGTVVGLGSLIYDEEAENAFYKTHASSSTPHECHYSFSVSGLVDAAFYGIEVRHRGVVRYSKADLQAKNWTVTLSLGQ
jgi:hypothetical protein